MGRLSTNYTKEIQTEQGLIEQIDAHLTALNEEALQSAKPQRSESLDQVLGDGGHLPTEQQDHYRNLIADRAKAVARKQELEAKLRKAEEEARVQQEDQSRRERARVEETPNEAQALLERYEDEAAADLIAKLREVTQNLDQLKELASIPDRLKELRAETAVCAYRQGLEEPTIPTLSEDLHEPMEELTQFRFSYPKGNCWIRAEAEIRRRQQDEAAHQRPQAEK